MAGSGGLGSRSPFGGPSGQGYQPLGKDSGGGEAGPAVGGAPLSCVGSVLLATAACDSRPGVMLALGQGHGCCTVSAPGGTALPWGQTWVLPSLCGGLGPPGERGE